MIRFFNQHNVPKAYVPLLAKMKFLKPIVVTDDDVYMVTTISEPAEHVILIHEWIDTHAPETPRYKGGLIFMALLKQDKASHLKLSLPLT